MEKFEVVKFEVGYGKDGEVKPREKIFKESKLIIQNL